MYKILKKGGICYKNVCKGGVSHRGWARMPGMPTATHGFPLAAEALPQLCPTSTGRSYTARALPASVLLPTPPRYGAGLWGGAGPRP